MTSHRPFRFGVLAERARSRHALVETARFAEAAGYATLLIRDHFVEAPFGHQLAPIAALATVAAATSRLRVGSLVFDNDYRHPVVLAKEAATLDLLSGGRFELGLGAGWLRAEYEQAGIPFDPPGARIERLGEALRVLKGLFADGPFTFAGRYYAVSGLDGFPKPLQRPHPPILIGGGGRRMLSLAAREADIVGILSASVASGVLSAGPDDLSAESFARKVDWIRQAAGDRFDRIELSVVISVVLGPDQDRAAAAFARAAGWDGVPVERVLAMPSVFVGSEDQVVATMRKRRERFGVSYFVVSDADAAAFAPVVARLGGR